ncbi:MAG: FIST N-terminal domain-containing protein [Nitrospiria bacterium]
MLVSAWEGDIAMNFWSGITTEPESHIAVEKLVMDAMQAIGAPPDLALFFISSHHRKAASEIANHLKQTLNAGVLLGCTGEGIIGSSHEIEEGPAISLWIASLPGVTLHPFHLSFEENAQGTQLKGWPEESPAPEYNPFFILLAEPFSTPADYLLTTLQKEFPFAPVLGGMASGARNPGENLLFFNDQAVQEGCVGIMAHGAIRLETVVSQGCRPVGDRFLVTSAERNIIHELGGRPALDLVKETYGKLSEQEKRLAQEGLHVGVAVDEQKGHFGRGDFLIRSLIGIDQDSGSLSCGDIIKEGQTLQLQVRDGESAREDLWLLLEARKMEMGEARAEAALLFSCNGRGERFFGRPHHDVGAIRECLGKIPLAGFFAQGEVGPIGRKNFLHGFTASIALFCKTKALRA